MRRLARRLVAVGCGFALLVAGCGGDDARTFYESLDLDSPEAAARTFVDAFARDDFMTVFLVFAAETQRAADFRVYGRVDRLIRTDAIGDLTGELRSALGARPDEAEAHDGWHYFDAIMMIADRHDAFLIDLSEGVTLGEPVLRGTTAEVPAQVAGLGEVTIRLATSRSGRWRVVQVALSGGAPDDVPWSLP